MQRDSFRLYAMAAVLLSLLLPVLLLVEVLVLERYHNHHHYCDLLLFSLLVQCRSQLAAYSTAFKFKGVFDYANLKPVSDLGFSVQTECTKPLTNRYQGDKIDRS